MKRITTLLKRGFHLSHVFICACLLQIPSFWVSSQFVHSGPWTGYIDGIGVSDMEIRDSFIYVNTYNGTARLDPVTRTYRYFVDMGVAGLPHFINMRYADIDVNGHLWAIHQEQLIRVDLEGGFHVEGPRPKYPPTVLAFDREGALWSGGISSILGEKPGEVLARFNGQDWDYVDVGFPGGYVDALAFDTLNRPWFTSHTDVFRFTGSSFEVVKDNGVNVYGGDFLEISDDQKVVSAGGVWLQYFDGQQWKVWTGYDVHYPVFDALNQLWFVNSSGEGFTLSSGQTSPQKVLDAPQNYRTGEYDDVYGFGPDHLGQLWIAKGTGLFVSDVMTIHPYEFIPLSPLLVPGPPDKGLAASGDTAWLLNQKGITRLIDDEFVQLSLPQEDITAIWYDEKRAGLWVGSAGMAGFYQGDMASWININPLLIDSIAHNDILEIKGDTMGNVWFRTDEGLLRYNASNEWRRFFFGEALPMAPQGIRYFYIRPSDASVWMMLPGITFPGFTIPDKLFTIAGDQVQQVDIETEVLENSLSIVVLSDSLMWFNSLNGVWRYDRGDVTSYVPGYVNNSELALYGDSTILLFSVHGLYIYHHGEWFHPDIEDVRLHNQSAIPFSLTPEGKIYMRNFSLLTLDPLDDLLDILDEGPSPTSGMDVFHFPNPVSETLFLDPVFVEHCHSCSAALYTSHGELIQLFPGPVPAQIDFNGIPAGLYVLAIVDHGHRMKALRIVKK